jgi:hypothetical protein
VLGLQYLKFRGKKRFLKLLALCNFKFSSSFYFFSL